MSQTCQRFCHSEIEKRRRCKSRKTETPESIASRIDKAEAELSYAEKFDYILLNDELNKAFVEAEKVVTEFLTL